MLGLFVLRFYCLKVKSIIGNNILVLLLFFFMSTFLIKFAHFYLASLQCSCSKLAIFSLVLKSIGPQT